MKLLGFGSLLCAQRRRGLWSSGTQPAQRLAEVTPRVPIDSTIRGVDKGNRSAIRSTSTARSRGGAESFASESLQRVARATRRDMDDRLGRTVLERHLVGRQQPRDVDERPALVLIDTSPCTCATTVARIEGSMSRRGNPQLDCRSPVTHCAQSRDGR